MLATFNGEQFIAEQLDSILHQRYQAWTLLIRDDGSTDTTTEIISAYEKRDQRIQLIENNNGPGGDACQNFSQLIEAGLKTNAGIFFLSDQDDIWNLNKINRQLQCIEEMDITRPCLTHHDLEVVDENLNPFHQSFFQLMQLNPIAASFNSLLGKNEVTGCTIACNRKLLECAYPIPKEAIMHDWWLALICAAIGKIEVINSPLTRYRQHSQNTIGAKSFWQGLNPFNNLYKIWVRGNQEFLSTICQAKALQEHFQKEFTENLLTPENSKSLLHYSTILEKPRLQRISYFKKNGLLKTHWLLNVVNQVRLLTL